MSNTAFSVGPEPFFGDDWDDDDLPTRVRTSSSVSIPAIAIQRPKSGIWKKVVEIEEPFPLVVRRIDPNEILDVMRAPPRPMPSPERTMEVLPWDVEVIEDQQVLRAMLAPPVIWPLPVLPGATNKAPMDTTTHIAIAILFGLACAAVGFVAVLALHRS